jgi:hypothetical protein
LGEDLAQEAMLVHHSEAAQIRFGMRRFAF